MQLTCPACHARNSFEAFIQDEAARELMALAADAGAAWRPLVTYLGFFRSKSRALAWDRALRLTREVLELANDRSVLAAALSETCASLDAKRAEVSWKPLTGHNYLRRVLEAVNARRGVGRIETTYGTDSEQPPAIMKSETGRAIAALELKKRERR